MSDKQPGGEYEKESARQNVRQDPKAEGEDTSGHSHVFDPKSAARQSARQNVRQDPKSEGDEDDVSGHAAAPKQVVRQGTPEPPTRDR